MANNLELDDDFSRFSMTGKTKLRLEKGIDLAKLKDEGVSELCFEKEDSDLELEELELDVVDGSADGSLELQVAKVHSQLGSYFRQKKREFEKASDITIEEVEHAALAVSSSGQVGYVEPVLDKNKIPMLSILPGDLITKQILKQGDGNKVMENCTVFAHYVIFVEGSNQSFDTTVLRRSPHLFRLAKLDILPAFYKALLSMEVGELSKFKFKSQLAYGEKTTMYPYVPPGKNIVCYLETLQIVDEAMQNSFLFLTAAERAVLPFYEILEFVDRLRIEGNDLYRRGDLEAAMKKYRKGLNILEAYPILHESDQDKQSKTLYRLYSNLSQCYLKLERPDQACIASKLAMKLTGGLKESKDVKLLFRFARGKFDQEKYDEAIKVCEQTLQISPDKDVEHLKNLAIAAKTKEKATAYSMFKGILQ